VVSHGDREATMRGHKKRECDEDRKRFARQLLLLEVAMPMAEQPLSPKRSPRRRTLRRVVVALGILAFCWALAAGNCG